MSNPADQNVEIRLNIIATGDAEAKIKGVENATKKLEQANRTATTRASGGGGGGSGSARGGGIASGGGGSVQDGIGNVLKKQLEGLMSKGGNPISGLLGQMGGGGGGMGGLLGGGAAGGGMAAAGAVAGPVAAAFGAYMAVSVAAGKAADVLNVMNNSTATAAQKQEALIDQYVPGAADLRKFGEAVNGTTEKLRQMGEQHEIETRRIQSEAAARQKESGLRHDATRQQAAGNAWQGMNFGGVKFFDRGTVAGEQNQKDSDRRQDSKDAIERARITVNAAKEAANEQERVMKDAIDNRGSAQNAVDRAEGNLNYMRDREQGNQKLGEFNLFSRATWMEDNHVAGLFNGGMKQGVRDKVGMQSSLNERKESGDELLNRSKEAETEITRHLERQKQLREAESQLRKEQINLAKVDLTILQEKEQRMASAQQKLGMMNGAQRQMAKEAALYIKQNGLQNATDEMKNLASSIAPGMVAKIAEKEGAKYTKEMSDAGLDDFSQDYGKGETLEEIRKQVDKVKAQVRVDIQLDAQETAKSIAETLTPFLRDILKEIQVQVAEEVRQARVGQYQRQENGGQ